MISSFGRDVSAAAVMPGAKLAISRKTAKHAGKGRLIIAGKLPRMKSIGDFFERDISDGPKGAPTPGHACFPVTSQTAGTI